jgi:hypothetical protein
VKLKYVYDSIDEVPEKYRDLYEELEDGGARFVGGEGFKSQADVDRLQEALRKERKAHADTKAKYKGLDGVDPEEVQRLRDENEELKARVEAGGGQIDEKKLDELAEKKAALKVRPVERERDKFKTDLEAATAQVTSLTAEKHNRTIVDALRSATQGDKGIKIVDTALADIEFLAPSVFTVGDDGAVRVRENAPGGVMAGASPREWLAEIQASGTRKHWFPGNVSAGAREGGGGGGGGVNPFAGKEPNLTEISRLVQKDPARARHLAAAADRLDLLPPELRRE